MTSNSYANGNSVTKSKSTKKHVQVQLKVGSWVKNGSAKPGVVTSLKELKPGNKNAWVRWEGNIAEYPEKCESLTVLEDWQFNWCWDEEKLLRHYDKKECFDLEFLITEIKVRRVRLGQAQASDDRPAIAREENRIAYVKALITKAIEIDKEFKNLIPPLSQEESNQLERNLQKEGCRDAILVWNNILIDGHNRFRLCKKNQIDFNLQLCYFETRQEAKEWIINNQLGRRNLSPKWIAYFRGEAYNQVKPEIKRGGDRRSANASQNNEATEKVERIARKAKTSVRTIQRDGAFVENMDKVCEQFGQEWKPILLDSNLTKAEIKQVAELSEQENCQGTIDSLLGNLERKSEDYKVNLNELRKISKQTLVIGQIVKIQFRNYNGLTEDQKKCDREYAIVTEVLEHSYKLKLIGEREIQIKAEDLQAAPVATYCVSFSAEEFSRLTQAFRFSEEIEEEAKRKLLMTSQEQEEQQAPVKKEDSSSELVRPFSEAREVRLERPIGAILCCGGGGSSIGMNLSGFDCLAAVDNDPVACKVHRANFPNCAVINEDIAKVTAEQLRARSTIGEREIDLCLVSAPCKGFSMQGKRNPKDPRNKVLLKSIALAIDLNPKYIVVENVKGLTMGDAKKFLESVIDSLKASGYAVVEDYQVLNAKDYNVPQSRERLFLLAYREGLQAPSYPAPLAKTPTVRDAIADLPNLDNYPQLWKTDYVESAEYGEPSDYAASLRVEDSKVLTSSKRTQHTKAVARRYLNTDPNTVDAQSRCFKLDWNGISNTILAGGDKGGHTAVRPIHPEYPRVCTVREIARLCSFPDSFMFNESMLKSLRILGNSIPPNLAEAVCSEIIKVL